MRKQKLNLRQQLRIKQQQEQKRQNAQAPSDNETSPLNQGQPGLLVAHYGQKIEVEDAIGQLHRCHARQNLGSIAVGDRVIWSADQHGNGVIVALEPRRTELFRYNKFEGEKLVAANLDQLYIIIAPEPPRAMNVLGRYLMLAELQGIKPIIVFNKIDLCPAETLSDIKDFLSYYQALDYTVLYTTVTQPKTVQSLYQGLQNQTSILVGLSGVGKSSLLKALLPNEIVAIGELSERSREGNHTTTTAKLFHLPEGGDVIDCPGIRELAIGELTTAQVLHGFKELANLAAHCQFRNCSHRHEPGCAILLAAEDDDFNHERLLSYHNIINEIASI